MVAKIGTRLIEVAYGKLVHDPSSRTRIAFCETTVENDGGQVVAEARAGIAYVKV